MARNRNSPRSENKQIISWDPEQFSLDFLVKNYHEAWLSLSDLQPLPPHRLSVRFDGHGNFYREHKEQIMRPYGNYVLDGQPDPNTLTMMLGNILIGQDASATERLYAYAEMSGYFPTSVQLNKYAELTYDKPLLYAQHLLPENSPSRMYGLETRLQILVPKGLLIPLEGEFDTLSLSPALSTSNPGSN